MGDWAVRALPVILEIVKKGNLLCADFGGISRIPHHSVPLYLSLPPPPGGRYDPRSLEVLRPSFREAVELAKTEWDEKASVALASLSLIS